MLSGAGFVAAAEEAGELLACAAGDAELLESLVGRRLTGEPFAWITGSVSFCGLEVRVDPGVYVPRWQSEPLARRAVERLPANGIAIDLCTGAGAMAKVLATSRPGALTEYWNDVPGAAGGWPTVPAGFCRFCACIALPTSAAVMPSLAILSGFTHTRIE